MAWTARELQVAAAYWCWHSAARLVVPNVFLYGWESDLLAITRAGYVWELEIKVSRADFQADMRKRVGNRRHGSHKHDLLSGAAAKRVGPKRFFFVVPRGLVTVDEVPSHCGLIEVGHSYSGRPVATTTRPAPDLKCGSRLTEPQLMKLAVSLSHRYMGVLCSSKTSPPTSMLPLPD